MVIGAHKGHTPYLKLYGLLELTEEEQVARALLGLRPAPKGRARVRVNTSVAWGKPETHYFAYDLTAPLSYWQVRDPEYISNIILGRLTELEDLATQHWVWLTYQLRFEPGALRSYYQTTIDPQAEWSRAGGERHYI